MYFSTYSTLKKADVIFNLYFFTSAFKFLSRMRFFSQRILFLKILRTFFFAFLTTQSLHFVLFSLYSFSFWQQSCFPTATSLLYGINKKCYLCCSFLFFQSSSVMVNGHSSVLCTYFGNCFLYTTKLFAVLFYIAIPYFKKECFSYVLKNFLNLIHFKYRKNEQRRYIIIHIFVFL